ncbi:MAG: ATP-binding protein [Burkholderiales bacterium]|nr:ATP-binding protein [Burkholderiales bacterium]
MPSPQATLFDLNDPVSERLLREMNPWWQGLGVPNLQPVRRWAYESLLRGLNSQLAPVVVLRGPRQVGKSTLQAQVIDELLRQGVDPRHILRVQFDDVKPLHRREQPILEVVWWYADHVLGAPLGSLGRQPVYLFLDEVQNLRDWAPQLKHLVDLQPVRAMVTGSSALRIEAGRDSLAGRIHTLELGPLLLREIIELRGLGQIPAYHPPNGLGPLKDKDFWLGLREFGERHQALRDQAFTLFSGRGGYPVAHKAADEPWERVADQLVETVVRRAIQHDLRMGSRGVKRDENLLEEVFRLACRYVGQSPKQALYLDEIRQALDANVGWQRVLQYLKFLDGALLVRLIDPLELRLKKRKSPAKLVLSDHSLRAAWLQESVPIDPAGLDAAPHLAVLAGRIAESVVGQFFKSIVNLDLAYFPERGAEPEVDYVLTVGEQRIPVEVKYRRRIEHADTRGLRAFIEKSHYNAPFGLLVTLGDSAASDDPRIVSLPLASLLLMR